MKFDKIIQTYENQPEIPKEIEESIINLFGVKKLREIQDKTAKQKE